MDERKSLQRFKSDMAISAPAAERVSREFQKQIEQGVQANTPNIHTMIPSMVARVPTGCGHEQGPFYGIHISGEHIHMLYTILSDVPYQVDLVQIQSSAISENLRTCTDEDFFAHVAQAFHAFLRSISRVLTGASNAACGLALSFPCLNESVQCGRLTKWTKGFDIAGTVGKDPAQMLSNAFAAQGINVKVVALCNNTVAELCVTRYRGLHADVALSMDTGSNASFEEAVEQIAKLDRGAVKALTHESMIINTEWPAFEPQTVRLLPEDFKVDDKSQRPGDQLFEKLTAPLYLGEVARLILIRVAEEQGWPEADNMQLRSLPGDLHVEQVIAVAEDTTQSLSLVRTLLQTIFKIDTTYFSQQVCQQVKEISVLVLARSAKLVAAAIVGIMLHKLHSSGLQAEPFTVAFAGKLSASHVYRRLLREALQEFSLWICPEYHPVKVLEVDDGAVFGAAVLAAATFASP